MAEIDSLRAQNQELQSLLKQEQVKNHNLEKRNTELKERVMDLTEALHKVRDEIQAMEFTKGKKDAPNTLGTHRD